MFGYYGQRWGPAKRVPALLDFGLGHLDVFRTSLYMLPVPPNQCAGREQSHHQHQGLVDVNASHFGGIQTQEFQEEPPYRIGDQVDQK